MSGQSASQDLEMAVAASPSKDKHMAEETAAINNSGAEEFKIPMAKHEGRQGQSMEDNSSTQSMEDSLESLVVEQSSNNAEIVKNGADGNLGPGIQSLYTPSTSSQILMPKAKISAESESDEWSYVSDESYQFDDAAEENMGDERGKEAGKLEMEDVKSLGEDEEHVEMDVSNVVESDWDKIPQEGIASPHDNDETADLDKETSWKDETKSQQKETEIQQDVAGIEPESWSQPIMPHARLSRENEGGSPLHANAFTGAAETGVMAKERHTERSPMFSSDSWSAVRTIFSNFYSENHSSGTNFLKADVGPRIGVAKRLKKSFKKLGMSSMKVKARASEVDLDALSGSHKFEENGSDSKDGAWPWMRAAASESEGDMLSTAPSDNFDGVSIPIGESLIHPAIDVDKDQVVESVIELQSSSGHHSSTNRVTKSQSQGERHPSAKAEGLWSLEDDAAIRGVQDGDDRKEDNLLEGPEFQNSFQHEGVEDNEVASESPIAEEVGSRAVHNFAEVVDETEGLVVGDRLAPQARDFGGAKNSSTDVVFSRDNYMEKEGAGVDKGIRHIIDDFADKEDSDGACSRDVMPVAYHLDALEVPCKNPGSKNGDLIDTRSSEKNNLDSNASTELKEPLLKCLNNEWAVNEAKPIMSQEEDDGGVTTQSESPGQSDAKSSSSEAESKVKNVPELSTVEGHTGEETSESEREGRILNKQSSTHTKFSPSGLHASNDKAIHKSWELQDLDLSNFSDAPALPGHTSHAQMVQMLDARAQGSDDTVSGHGKTVEELEGAVDEAKCNGTREGGDGEVTDQRESAEYSDAASDKHVAEEQLESLLELGAMQGYLGEETSESDGGGRILNKQSSTHTKCSPSGSHASNDEAIQVNRELQELDLSNFPDAPALPVQTSHAQMVQMLEATAQESVDTVSGHGKTVEELEGAVDEAKPNYSREGDDGEVTDHRESAEYSDAASDKRVAQKQLESLPGLGAMQGYLGEETFEFDSEGRILNKQSSTHTKCSPCGSHASNDEASQVNRELQELDLSKFPDAAALLEHGMHAQMTQWLGAAAAESADTVKHHGNTVEELEVLRLKFLQVVARLGQSEKNVVVAQVLHRLILAKQLRVGHNEGQTWHFDIDASSCPEKLDLTDQDMDFKCSILLLGRTGVGKSATVNSMFGGKKAGTDAFSPSTGKLQVIKGEVHGIKVSVIDTPGLLPSYVDQRHNYKVLASVKRLIKKHPPDVVLFFGRLDTRSDNFDDLPLMRTITNSFGSEIWSHAIILFTHASAAPPDGFNGLPVCYETFVSHRCHAVQQTIRELAGDSVLVNPVSLVENNKSASRQKWATEWAPFNDRGWIEHLYLLCFASKTLGDLNKLLGQQRPFSGTSQHSSPALPLLLSSLLQSQAQMQLLHQLAEEHAESGNWRSSYQKKVWSVRNRRKGLQKKVQDLLSGSAGQLTFENVVPIDCSLLRLANTLGWLKPVLPWISNCSTPSYRYRCLEIGDHYHVMPIKRPQDHDNGHYTMASKAISPVRLQFPSAVSNHIVRRDSMMHLDCSAFSEHKGGGITLMDADLETPEESITCTIQSETRFSDSKENKATQGAVVMVIGDRIYCGLKLADRFFAGQQLKATMNGGIVTGSGGSACSGSLQILLPKLDHFLQPMQSVGLSLMNWRGSLAIIGTLQSQLVLGGAVLTGKMNVNVDGNGNISLRARSHDHFQIAFIGCLPVIKVIVNWAFRTYICS